MFVRLSTGGPRGVSEIEIGGDELIGALSGLGLRYRCCAIELCKVSYGMEAG